MVRTGPRHDTVYLYPVKASRAALRALFVDVLGRANALAVQPEFYNTAVNNCTTAPAGVLVSGDPLRNLPAPAKPGYTMDTPAL